MRQITFGGLHCTGGVGQHAVQLCLRARFSYTCFPLSPNLIIHALDGHFGFRRLPGPHIGLNGALEGADAVDVGLHAKLVEQAFIIWLRSAGAGNHCAAQRVHPDLRGMGRQLIAVVGIGRGEGIDRLARLFHRFKAVADCCKAGLSAAHEPLHVDNDQFHPLIFFRQLERANDIALPDFARRHG